MINLARRLLKPRHTTILSKDDLAAGSENNPLNPASPQFRRATISGTLKQAHSYESVAFSGARGDVVPYPNGVLPQQRSSQEEASQASSSLDMEDCMPPESPPARSKIQSLTDLIDNDYLSEIQDIVVPVQKTGVNSSGDKSNILILWPANNSVAVDPEFDTVDFEGQPQSLPNFSTNFPTTDAIVQESSDVKSVSQSRNPQKEFTQPTTVIPPVSPSLKRGLLSKVRSSSPLKINDNPKKENRQMSPLTVNLKDYEMKTTSPKASPLAKRSAAATSASSPVPPSRTGKSKRRGRGADKSVARRFKTHGGISLTDDEKLLGRRDHTRPSPPQTTLEEPPGDGGLHRRRGESWRSSSLTEKTPMFKISGSTDDLLRVEKFKPVMTQTPGGAAVITMSQLHMFVLLQGGDELEENMEFEVI